MTTPTRQNLGFLIAISVAACGGGSRTAANAPPATPEPARTPGTPGAGAWFYRMPVATRYVVTRLDSLTLGAGDGVRPQVSEKVAHVTVRSHPPTLVISLDSVVAMASGRPLEAAQDSVRGLKWEAPAGRQGLSAPLQASMQTVLAEQLGAALGLLFTQLPTEGAQVGKEWSDTERVNLRLDAFRATEDAKRVVTVTTGAPGSPLQLAARSDLTRTGVAVMGGQELRLQGTGRRDARYELAPGGWPARLTSRDSLALSVTMPGNAVPVQWITRIVIEADAPPR
jgi:hypothetical protein